MVNVYIYTRIKIRTMETQNTYNQAFPIYSKSPSAMKNKCLDINRNEKAHLRLL